MLSSTLNLKFLLDENIPHSLYRFIQSTDHDVVLVPNSATDKDIATASLKQQCVVVTKDTDFLEYTTQEIFAVVLIELPQKDKNMLLNSFTKMLRECNTYKGYLVLIKKNGWEKFPLPK